MKQEKKTLPFRFCVARAQTQDLVHDSKCSPTDPEPLINDLIITYSPFSMPFISSCRCGLLSGVTSSHPKTTFSISLLVMNYLFLFKGVFTDPSLCKKFFWVLNSWLTGFCFVLFWLTIWLHCSGIFESHGFWQETSHICNTGPFVIFLCFQIFCFIFGFIKMAMICLFPMNL